MTKDALVLCIASIMENLTYLRAGITLLKRVDVHPERGITEEELQTIFVSLARVEQRLTNALLQASDEKLEAL